MIRIARRDVAVALGAMALTANRVWKWLGPGSIILNASSSLHALRTVGAEPTTCHVINWKTSATPAN
ncbi:MAG: hypothetical protein ABI810_19405 [Sphingomonas bacterium]